MTKNALTVLIAISILCCIIGGCAATLDLTDSAQYARLLVDLRARGGSADIPDNVDVITLPNKPVAWVGAPAGISMLTLRDISRNKIVNEGTIHGHGIGALFHQYDMPLAPGEYQVELSQDRKVLLSRKFTVVGPK
ncbi:hypothetical protein [uncultured Thiodictyon sp.]|jgi:hypothetical protein|uniref:hypothetical protein n=1 Tax=uncultured Thiodictyon sp. TaxID=1846217 RepID=UPI0025F9D595|nr:hypothetical protein [uncultured Thiodictyon sp.]